MIREILYLIFFTSAFVLAWKTAISEQMVLETLGKYFQYKIERGYKVYELFFCQWCAPTLFSILSWSFMFALEIVPFAFDFKYIAVHLIGWWSSCFLCGITWTAYLTMNARKERDEAAKDYYEAATKYYEHAEKIAHFEIKDRKEQHYKKQHPSNGVKNN